MIITAEAIEGHGRIVSWWESAIILYPTCGIHIAMCKGGGQEN